MLAAPAPGPKPGDMPQATAQQIAVCTSCQSVSHSILMQMASSVRVADLLSPVQLTVSVTVQVATHKTPKDPILQFPIHAASLVAVQLETGPVMVREESNKHSLVPSARPLPLQEMRTEPTGQETERGGAVQVLVVPSTVFDLVQLQFGESNLRIQVHSPKLPLKVAFA